MGKTKIIETKSGNIQGYITNNVKIFKGIPYAEPPVGKLRFLAPIPKENWYGILDATNFSPQACQPPPLPVGILQPIVFPKSEDACLTLNIWTPDADREKRAVLVWIHGGDFVRGGSSSPMYDGFNLVNIGNVVVVTINYRLGVLGFLNVPEVTANVGLLDQIAALKWIHKNIESFGGNPNNITIFGESAGARSVITLCAMPDANGLFHRVIAQSNPYYYASNGVKGTEEFMMELGLQKGDINSLQNVPVNKLLQAQEKIYMKSNRIGITQPWVPQVDGKTLLQDPLEFFQDGKANIDLLIGSNLDENKLFSFMDPRAPNTDMQRVKSRMNRLMKYFKHDENKADICVKTYIEEREEFKLSNNPRDLFDGISSDLWFRILSIRLAEVQCKKKSTYMYLFTWESPYIDPKQGKLSSAHSIEISFVFGMLDLPGMELFAGKGEAAEQLSKNMMNSWIAFAKTGNPNHTGIPEWKSYDSENRSTIILDKEIKTVNDPFKKTRLIWDGIF